MDEEITLNAGPRVRAYIEEIAAEMAAIFQISRREAVGRINQYWRHVEFSEAENPPDLIFHESPTYWAKTIYYGKDSKWWQGEEGLEPLPYENT